LLRLALGDTDAGFRALQCTTTIASCFGDILDESRLMPTTGRRQSLRIVLGLPELNLALFAFLLNFV
jgi:hypothetical protein